MIDLADPQNPDLVRQLVRAKYPDLGSRPITYAGAGWDNALYRVGADLVARFPRKEDSVSLIGVEHAAFSHLEDLPAMPLELPKLVMAGTPTEAFAYPWSLLTWIDGESYVDRPAYLVDRCVHRLARFLTVLHRPAPQGLGPNPHRGIDLQKRDSAIQTCLARLPDDEDVFRNQIGDVWNDLVGTPAWNGRELWLHGDLHPGNLLARQGKLHAVIDWGDTCSGDPASDLSVAWMLFGQKGRSDFRATLSSLGHPVDESMWARARGWAVSLGLAHLTGSDNTHHIRLGRQTIVEALTQD